MAPTGDEYEVALEALRDDAAVWSDTATVLDDANTAAKTLLLESSEFSWAGDLAGLPDVYRELKDKVVDLLAQGRDASNSVSDQLLAAADMYENEEEEGVHRMNGVW